MKINLGQIFSKIKRYKSYIQISVNWYELHNNKVIILL